ncbi:MAG TPA: hypothetical protein VIS51_08350 [Solirubrobacterales bacterium]
MSSDLITWIVAIALGLAVVGLGWRRDLGDVTRNWLPRFGEASEQATETRGLSKGGQGRRQLSPRQRQLAIWGYLLIGLCNAAFAVLWVDGRLRHVIFAATFATLAVVHMLKGRHLPQLSSRLGD